MIQIGTTQEYMGTTREYAVRADRRRALRRVRGIGLREVPRAVRRATLSEKEVSKPSAIGKTFDSEENSRRRALILLKDRRAHRRIVRQQLAAIDTADLIEEIHERGYQVVPLQQVPATVAQTKPLVFISNIRHLQSGSPKKVAVPHYDGMCSGDHRRNKYSPTWFRRAH